MNILVFAGLAEAAGGPSVTLDLELPAKVADVKTALAEACPTAKPLLDGCFAAINQTYATDDAIVREGDEVAFIPPVSGG